MQLTTKRRSADGGQNTRMPTLPSLRETELLFLTSTARKGSANSRRSWQRTAACLRHSRRRRDAVLISYSLREMERHLSARRHGGSFDPRYDRSAGAEYT